MFRSQKPRFIAKEERELIEVHDPDRSDDFQERARADKEHDNLIHYGKH